MTPRMSEAQWQQLVLDVAHINGFRSMHVRRSVGRRRGEQAWQTATSCDGWPDLILWRPGELLAVELKSDTGRLTQVQADVLYSLAVAGADTDVWRPRDWPYVQQRLRRRR